MSDWIGADRLLEDELPLGIWRRSDISPDRRTAPSSSRRKHAPKDPCWCSNNKRLGHDGRHAGEPR